MKKQRSKLTNSGGSHPTGEDSPEVQPSHIKVEEKLHYWTGISDRTEISLKEATGQIEVVFPAPPAVEKKNSLEVPIQVRVGRLPGPVRLPGHLLGAAPAW
jgi:hypothetical protein